MPRGCSRASCTATAVPSPALTRYRDLFGDRCYLLAELCRGPEDRGHVGRLIHASQTSGVPLVAANDVHYHDRSRQVLQDVLAATRHGCTVAELGFRRFPNAERFPAPAGRDVSALSRMSRGGRSHRRSG